MFFLKLVLLALAVTADHYVDLAAQQLVTFEEKTKAPIGVLTTANGAPVEFLDANISLNRRILFNEYLSETITHLNRQRIPERVVHARGAGAFGYFEVTHDITDICRAKFLNQIGKRTPIAVRFSLISVNLGSIDLTRDGRGFALKFYTEDGNFDLLGLSTPVFSYKDPLFFPTFANAQGRNPATFAPDSNMLWDYITLRPETIHFFMYKFGDPGIPNGWRHMPGFGVHTFQVVNQYGVSSFVRFHFICNQGNQHLKSEEAAIIGGLDPDYALKDLYNAIANGDFPSWQLSMQVLSWHDVRSADFDVFDITRILPLDKYPLRPVGHFVLNRNPVNFFSEIEQIALNPTHLVDGILGAPDKVFEARRLGYRDAQYYRLGANFPRIPVNCPLRMPYTYNNDGRPPVKISDAPIYYPNSFNGPQPYHDPHRVELVEIVQDTSDNFDQASDLYESLTEDAKTRLVGNIVDSLGKAAVKIQRRALKWFSVINVDFSKQVELGLTSRINRTDTFRCGPKPGPLHIKTEIFEVIATSTGRHRT